MQGMNAITGEPVTGNDYLIQLIKDVLTTPIGTRVMRRNYGSRLFSLVDSPIDALQIAHIQTAIYEAINQNVPQIKLTGIHLAPNQQYQEGKLSIQLTGYTVIDNKPINIDNISF